MLGVLDTNQPASSLVHVFANSLITNVLVVDDRRHLVDDIDEHDWRRFLTSGIDDTMPMGALLGAFREAVPDNPRAGLMAESRFGRIRPVLENGAVVGTIIEPGTRRPARKAAGLIMAGGLGRRLGEITRTTPKPMLDLAGAPISKHLVENMTDNGIEDIYFSIYHLKEAICGYYGDGSAFDCSIQYLEERRPLGTGGCLSLLPDDFDSNLVIVNGDVVTTLQFGRLLEYHEKCGNAVTMSVRPYKVQLAYGVVESQNGEVIRLTEKPKVNFNINAAVYVVSPEVLRYVPQRSRIDMPSLISSLLPFGLRVGVFPLVEEWIDVGNVAELERARETYSPESRPRVRVDPYASSKVYALASG